MLIWNLKNVEYALGANFRDLSMKFWDIDERHAFEGDHVMLRQGFSVVVEHLLKQLQTRGFRFQQYLDFPVGKLEYARKTTSQTYASAEKRSRLVDLTDTCRVTSQDGQRSIKCDFVVCTVPLGVLKEAIHTVPSVGLKNKRLQFCPPLPFAKRDTIDSVGSGLLDKVYLQFPAAFWRHGEAGLGPDELIFGNASGINPHHYMFFDIGRCLGANEIGEPPAILVSAVSGIEAVACEWLSSDHLVEEVLTTLRTLFSPDSVPNPIASRTTCWARDPFSRGSYTFLPPGTTDQDFQSLQSPVNGNGDSMLLDGLETMRLFFAGEHTTALHPSTAHGALLSGIRAAEEVLKAMTLHFEDEEIDRMIPMSIFRHMNPESVLECGFCHLVGDRAYEGPLLAFRKGSRQVLVHNSCAESSPEVEINDGKWKNVLKAVNRCVSIECVVCSENGASIGCNAEGCYRSYHFRCAEQTGWSFQSDGKEYLCKDHRKSSHKSRGVGETFQHALFSKAETKNYTAQGEPQPSSASDLQDSAEKVCRLTSELDNDGSVETILVHLSRPSLNDCWNLELSAMPLPGDEKSILSVAVARNDDPYNRLVEGDMVKAINGVMVGSDSCETVQHVVSLLGQEVDILMEIERSIE